MNSLAASIVLELDQEAIATRRMLARVPDDRFDWRPHPKSMSLGELASHIVESFTWIGSMTDRDELEMDPESYTPWRAANTEELLRGYDENLELAKAKIGALPDDRLLAEWRMKAGGQVLLQLPRIAVVKTFTVNHQIHHRGQLDVYLRLLDIPLPQVYGPSADEPDMAPTG